MWDLVDETTGFKREAELKSKDTFFKLPVTKGAAFQRHFNTQESAHAIIRGLLARKPVALRIEQEILSGKTVSQTAAGRILTEECVDDEGKL